MTDHSEPDWTLQAQYGLLWPHHYVLEFGPDLHGLILLYEDNTTYAYVEIGNKLFAEMKHSSMTEAKTWALSQLVAARLRN